MKHIEKKSSKKQRSSSQNGVKAGRTHTLRAAERRFGALSDKEKSGILTWAERYQKARTIREEQIALKQQLTNEARSRQLIPAVELHEWRHRLVTGIRRELDALKVVMLDVVPDPIHAEAMAKSAATINQRIRARLQAMPELKGT